MSEPSDYQRPSSWPTLPGSGGAGGSAAGAPPPSPPVAQQPPEQYPLCPPATGPRWGPPGQPPSWRAATTSQPRNWRGTPPSPQPAWRGVPPVSGGRGPRPGLALGLVAGIVLLLVFPVMFIGAPTTPRPTRSYSYTPAPPNLRATWIIEPQQVRTDLPGAEFVGGIDGSMDGGYLADLKTAWIALSGTDDDKQIAVHALDPTSGRQLWTRGLEQGLCATEPVSAGLVCAEAIATDPSTGLGTRWRLLVLDVQSGRVLRSTELNGWFTLIHVHDNRIMLVEQRQPAPHAVVRLLDEKLGDSRELDLSGQKQHAGLFSNDRIIYRKFPIPDGPALDRPRFRHVADGLIGLWSGSNTAVIDPRRGTVVGVLRCSRFVDDGQRLWCNDGQQAVAYDYRLRRLHETAIGIRLAFPVRDPEGGDVTDPVFVDMQGIARRVDLATGKTIGVLAPTTNESVWGMTLEPRIAFSHGVTLISDKHRTFAVDARKGFELWHTDEYEVSGEVLSRGGDLLVLDSMIRRIEGATGKVLGTYVQGVGLYTDLLGDTLVGYGPGQIGRLVDP